MVKQKLTQAQLGDRLNVDPQQVRRILDLDHESTLSQLDAALTALGLRATVDISKISVVGASAAA